MIKRHQVTEKKIGTKESLDNYLVRIQKGMTRLQDGKVLKLESFKNRGLSLARLTLMLKEDIAYAYTGLKYYLDIGIAHFRKVLSVTENLDISFGRKTFKVSKELDRYGTDLSHWYDLLNVAIILRDTMAQQVLLAMPVWKHNQDDDKYSIAAAKHLSAVLTQDTDKRVENMLMVEKEAKSTTGLFIGLAGNSSTIVPERPEILSRLSLPIQRLFELTVNKDSITFNKVLQDYLFDVRAYIVENEIEDDFAFWINFKALGCCAYAYDQGMDIRVESDYIPTWLYRGEFDDKKLLV